MVRAILLVLLIYAAIGTCNAETTGRICSKLSAQLEDANNNFRPPLEAKVVGKGQTFLHTAPDARCKLKNVLLKSGDSLTVYKPYGDWMNVMFVRKDGEDFSGWVRVNRIQVIGQYGRNP